MDIQMTEKDFLKDFGMEVYVECRDVNFVIKNIYITTSEAKDFIDIQVNYKSPRSVVLFSYCSSHMFPNFSEGVTLQPINTVDGDITDIIEVGLSCSSIDINSWEGEVNQWDCLGIRTYKYGVSVYFKKNYKEITYTYSSDQKGV